MAAAASVEIVGLEDLPDSPSGSPVAVKQAAAVIAGVHTEIIVSKYSNMVLVVVTQYEKIGSLMHVSCGNAADPSQIAKKIAATSNPPLPLLLGLALKEPDTKLLRVIVDLVQENKAW